MDGLDQQATAAAPAAAVVSLPLGIVPLSAEDTASRLDTIVDRGEKKQIDNKVDKSRGAGERCKHGKMRSRCKDCLSDVICIHNKRKSECAECGSHALCVHGKRKYGCKECGGEVVISFSKNLARGEIVY